MHAMVRLTVALGLAAGGAPGLLAQSAADATAAVAVTDGGDITVVKVQDLDFGTRTSGSVVNSSDVGAYASWNVTLNAGGTYSVTFTLPSSLQRSGGGSVPISFGSFAASSPEIQGIPAWDPTVGIGVEAPGGGAFSVELGKDVPNDGTGDATVNLAGAPAGTYSGTITLTVAVLTP